MHFGINEKPTTVCVSLYNAGLISISDEIASENAKNCRYRQPNNPLPPSQGTPANICINLILPESSHWTIFLPPTVWVYLHSNFRGGLRNVHVLCNRVRNGRLVSSKVVDFGTNRKGVCNFPLVINSNYRCYLAPFLRYGDLLAKNCKFLLPHSYLTPSLGVNPFEFLAQLFIAKTRILGLSVSEDCVTLVCVVYTF